MLPEEYVNVCQLGPSTAETTLPVQAIGSQFGSSSSWWRQNSTSSSYNVFARRFLFSSASAGTSNCALLEWLLDPWLLGVLCIANDWGVVAAHAGGVKGRSEARLAFKKSRQNSGRVLTHLSVGSDTDRGETTRSVSKFGHWPSITLQLRSNRRLGQKFEPSIIDREWNPGAKPYFWPRVTDELIEVGTSSTFLIAIHRF